MNHQRSQFLSERGLRGLAHIGDAYFPGTGAFPSFSQCGCMDSVDAVLSMLPESDRKSLSMLLGIVGTLPRFVARWLVALAEKGANAFEPIGSALRFLSFGLRGLVTSLYFSGEVGAGCTGPSPLEVIGYEVGVYTADVDSRERGKR